MHVAAPAAPAAPAVLSAAREVEVERTIRLYNLHDRIDIACASFESGCSAPTDAALAPLQVDHHCAITLLGQLVGDCRAAKLPLPGTTAALARCQRHLSDRVDSILGMARVIKDSSQIEDDFTLISPDEIRDARLFLATAPPPPSPQRPRRRL